MTVQAVYEKGGGGIPYRILVKGFMTQYHWGGETKLLQSIQWNLL